MGKFIEECKRTECQYGEVKTRIDPRIVHASFGLQTEVGELIDAFKKSWFYGQPLDSVNVREEIGDVLYYLAILCDEMDTDFETEMTRVTNKLKSRYPEKFTIRNAIDRDLAKERAILNERNQDI
tara:strand:+ start:2022 stop:2396 length:375 start_codon:yes stop_codon:yes gene_type:complete